MSFALSRYACATRFSRLGSPFATGAGVRLHLLSRAAHSHAPNPDSVSHLASSPPVTTDSNDASATLLNLTHSLLKKKTLPVRRAVPVYDSFAETKQDGNDANTKSTKMSPVKTRRVIAYAPFVDCSVNFVSVMKLATASAAPMLTYSVLPPVSDDVLNVSACDSRGPLGELFIFKDGCIVAWGPHCADLARSFISTALQTSFPPASIANQPLLTEEIDYVEDPSRPTSLVDDAIIIGNSVPSPLAKLAFSEALSRSAKVAAIEVRLDTFLDSIRSIPDNMATGVALNLTRSAVFAKIGALMRLRAQIYLSGSVDSLMDTPDYYWSRPLLGEYFEKASHWLDIEPRISVLNRKLDYASYCVEVIRSDLSERHSQKLEFMIIALITVEVVFELLYFYERRTGQKEAAELAH